MLGGKTGRSGVVLAISSGVAQVATQFSADMRLDRAAIVTARRAHTPRRTNVFFIYRSLQSVARSVFVYCSDSNRMFLRKLIGRSVACPNFMCQAVCEFCGRPDVFLRFGEQSSVHHSKDKPRREQFYYRLRWLKTSLEYR